MFDADLLRTLLVCLLAVPTVAAAVVALFGKTAPAARGISLAAVLVNLALTAVLVVGFIEVRAEGGAAMRATFQPELVPGSTDDNRYATTWRMIDLGPLGGVDFFLGVDGLNVWLLALTAVLMVSSVLISWTAVTERVNEYYAWLLLLGTAMTGVFLAFDIILFYIFFELTLVPLFFLIGIWGGPERRHAARKFFIYTLAGSVIALLGLLAIVVACHDATGALTFAIPDLVRTVNAEIRGGDNAAFWQSFQFWVFLALVAGFAIKVPLVPVHTWLPLAHVEAPTAGSVLLAGVLLKIGSYGFLRLCLPMTPDACLTLGVPLIGILSVIGILYGAFCALAQDDIKKMVAYSSVSHMGFCMLGMFALNVTGLTGSLLQMINHGLSTGGLFLLVGMVYERYHTRRMADFSGLGNKLKLLTVCMVFIVLTSVGLPGLNGFVGEAMVFFGMFPVQPALAIVGTAGIVLGAWYLLNLLRGVFFGPLKEPAHDGHHEETHDMNPREWAALGPIMALCLLLGVYPQPVIDVAEPDVRVVADIMRERSQALAARDVERNDQQARAGRGNER